MLHTCFCPRRENKSKLELKLCKMCLRGQGQLVLSGNCTCQNGTTPLKRLISIHLACLGGKVYVVWVHHFFVTKIGMSQFVPTYCKWSMILSHATQVHGGFSFYNMDYISCVFVCNIRHFLSTNASWSCALVKHSTFH